VRRECPARGRAALRILLRHALRVGDVGDRHEFARALAAMADRETAEAAMSTGDRLIEQGMQQGMQKGVQDMLLRQLGLRFGEIPPSFVSRLRAGGIEQLRTWTERVLTANSLAQVFGD